MPNNYHILTNEAAATNKENGILYQHYKLISDFAKKTKSVIAIRGVNKVAKSLIEDGYPTKGIDIKAKSSDAGIYAGFIISDPDLDFLSKVGLKANETQTQKITTLIKNKKLQLAKANRLTNEINEKELQLSNREMVLEISEKRIHSLLLDQNKSELKIIEFKKISDQAILTKSSIKSDHKENALFYLKTTKNSKTYQVYFTFAVDDKGHPINLNDKTLDQILVQHINDLILYPLVVYCAEVNKKKMPLVPDYDLWGVFKHLDEGIKWYQPPIPTNAHRRRHSVSSQENFHNIGNGSRAVVEFLSAINKFLKYKGLTDPKAVFKHGDQISNPQADDISDASITFFLPNEVSLDNIEIQGKKIISNNGNKVDYLTFENLDKSNTQAVAAFIQILTEIQKQQYYVPNNISLPETNTLGLVKAKHNPWITKDIEVRRDRSLSDSHMQRLKQEQGKKTPRTRTVSDSVIDQLKLKPEFDETVEEELTLQEIKDLACAIYCGEQYSNDCDDAPQDALTQSQEINYQEIFA